MQDYIKRIKEFYIKNRIIIIAVLGILIINQIFSSSGRDDRREKTLKERIEVFGERVESETKPLQELYQDEIDRNSKKNPDIVSIMLIVGLVLLFYVANKRGWVQKFMPSVVWVSIKVKKIKTTNEHIGTITIVNQTKESITFSPPVIAFGRISQKSRKFRIKAGEGQNIFPLTLMPGTSHQVTINLDAFRIKAEGLEGYNWVKVSVEGGYEKHYSSIWKYMF